MSFSFFLEMAWKSALIAGGALALLMLLKSRAPEDRAALLRLAIALLLMLPIVSLLFPALEVELLAPEAAAPMDPAALAAIEMAVQPTAASAEPGFWDDPTMLFALLYAGGVLMVGFRLAAGLATLGRWTRRAEPVEAREWTQLFEGVRDEAGATPRLRLLVSEEAAAPLSWGWLNPVILLDRDTHDRTEDAEAILAHETAHVVRGDWPTLMLARLAVVLFWFNPLVWLLERAMIQEAEEAADNQALKRLEPARYAQTLVNCLQYARALPLPAHSIGSAGLKRRVEAVLGGRRVPQGSLVSLGAMVATVAFAAPVAALELTEKARDASAPAPAFASAEAPVAEVHARPAAAPRAAPRAALAPAPFPSAVAPAPPAEAAPAAEAPPAPKAPLRYAFAAAPNREVAQDHIVDGKAIAEAVAEAQREAAHARAGIDHEALSREVSREVARETAKAMREAKLAQAEAHREMKHGAAGMERGAEDMERGAREMREEARKLRSSAAYREKVIRENAERGKTVTHDDLLRAADGMESGSRGMEEGARSMRKAAADMRRHRVH